MSSSHLTNRKENFKAWNSCRSTCSSAHQSGRIISIFAMWVTKIQMCPMSIEDNFLWSKVVLCKWQFPGSGVGVGLPTCQAIPSTTIAKAHIRLDLVHVYSLSGWIWAKLNHLIVKRAGFGPYTWRAWPNKFCKKVT